MIKRTTPRTEPSEDNGRFLRVDIEKIGKFWFKMPFPMDVAKVMVRFNEKRIKSLEKEVQEDVAAKLEIADEVTNLTGALMGISWYHLKQDLVTDIKDYDKDYASYGRAVLTELFEAGLEMSDFTPIFEKLIPWLNMTDINKEADSRVNFF